MEKQQQRLYFGIVFIDYSVTDEKVEERVGPSER